MRRFTRERRFFLVIVAVGLIVAGCSGDNESARQSRATARAAGASEATGNECDHPPGSLQCIDWQNHAIPGSVCGVETDVRLTNGEASVRSKRHPEYESVGLSANDSVVYGDLDGDGKEEAAIGTWCDNKGGTAAGQLGQEWVIFTRRGEVRSIGSVRPFQPRDDVHISYSTQLLIAPGRIISLDYFYGDHDSTCCPSGQALSTWRYADGKLTLAEREILSKPNQFPPEALNEREEECGWGFTQARLRESRLGVLYVKLGRWAHGGD